MLTQAERQARTHWIGASEAAAVLGVDPFKTAYEVWCAKTGRIEDFQGNAATDAGNRFEPIILDWAEEQLGPLARNVSVRLGSDPIAATCDAVTANRVPVEAKTGGLFGPLSDVWGRDGSDEVPERYIVQAHVQMLCTESEVAHLAAFLGGRGFCMFRVLRSDRLAAFIRERLNQWWAQFVLADNPPEYDPAVVAEVQRRIVRVPDKIVEIDPSIAAEYAASDFEFKAAEKRLNVAKAAVIDAMRDGEVAEFGDPTSRLTFFSQSRTDIDQKALRQQMPDVAERFTRKTSFRVLRVSKKKGSE